MARIKHPASITLLLTSSIISSTLALPSRPRSQDTTYNTTTTLPPNSFTKSINFTSCPAELNFPPTLECGTLSVPINWDAPQGEHFNLGIVRLPAPSNSTSKIGPLFINPGGPGGRASELVAGLAAGALEGAEELLNAFDIIGIDPRGVGLSGQVKCDMGIYAERVSLFPNTQEEFDKLADKNKRLGESCRERTGPLLEYIDTISAAKDHEAVRIALGDKPINLLGQSYGTQLFTQYAELFPSSIRTLVLDGVLLHSQSEASNVLIETTSYSLGLSHFLTWASTNDSSPLKGQDVEKLWFSLLSNASSTPIPAPSCSGKDDCAKDVTAEEILFTTQGYMIFASITTISPNNWAILASAMINATTNNDASAFSHRFDDPTAISGLAISCLDWTHNASLNLAGVQEKKRMGELYAPLTQGASQSWQAQHACIGWPYAPTNPPKKLDVDIDATTLMVNSDTDPSTGYPWAVGMREEVRKQVLVTRKGDGHTSFALGGETTRVIGKYLLTGEAPEDGLITQS